MPISGFFNLWACRVICTCVDTSPRRDVRDVTRCRVMSQDIARCRTRLVTTPPFLLFRTLDWWPLICLRLNLNRMRILIMWMLRLMRLLLVHSFFFQFFKSHFHYFSYFCISKQVPLGVLKVVLGLIKKIPTTWNYNKQYIPNIHSSHKHHYLNWFIYVVNTIDYQSPNA